MSGDVVDVLDVELVVVVATPGVLTSNARAMVCPANG